jgi:hypothetical protein
LTIVGSCLLGFGLKWLFQSGSQWLGWLLFTTVIVGVGKGNFFLKKSAQRTIHRILKRGDNRTIFGVFSIPSWLLVLVMITMGRFLRISGLPDDLLGALYASVGIALLMGSIEYWFSLQRQSTSNG